MNYLHTMLRVADPEASVAFFKLLGLEEVRRIESDKGRFSLIFLAVPEDTAIGDRRVEVELTYNWPPEDGSAAEVYTGGRNFGHLAYRVDDIHALCQRLMDAGVTINRPPRDGHMAFVRSPDGISIELLQAGGPKEPAEPWASMPNTGGVVMAADKSRLEIVRVPVLQDNYAWLVYDPETEDAAVVDPGEAGPVLAAAKQRGWHVSQVWTTHWHPDHTGGNAAMKAAGATVTGPKAEAAKIPTLDTLVGDGDVIRLGAHTGRVFTVPGHTQGHVAFHFRDDAILFTGDTLFAMGCGRLFEGTPADMFANMRAYAAMPDETMVYCGHEYTQSNGRYAAHVEPDNRAIAERMVEVDAARARGEATVPTTIALEKATNPFLRAGSVEELGQRRAEKDGFRG